MKIETEVVETIEKKKIEYYCDVCQDEIERRRRTCEFCRRDLCNKHAYEFQSWGTSLAGGPGTHYDGDYPDYICEECWDLGKEHREAIDKIRADAEIHEEALFKSWQRICDEQIVGNRNATN